MFVGSCFNLCGAIECNFDQEIWADVSVCQRCPLLFWFGRVLGCRLDLFYHQQRFVFCFFCSLKITPWNGWSVWRASWHFVCANLFQINTLVGSFWIYFYAYQPPRCVCAWIFFGMSLPEQDGEKGFFFFLISDVRFCHAEEGHDHYVVCVVVDPRVDKTNTHTLPITSALLWLSTQAVVFSV